VDLPTPAPHGRLRKRTGGGQAGTLGRVNDLIRVGYARCSTDEQDVIIQTEQLLALGVPADRIYIDRGFSGTTRRNRGGLDQARGRGTRGQPLAVRWIMVWMVTTTCGNTKDRVIAPDYAAMFGPKADSTLLVVHRPDLLEQPVPLMTVPLFLDPGYARGCSRGDIHEAMRNRAEIETLVPCE
jgi:hypothetical protein